MKLRCMLLSSAAVSAALLLPSLPAFAQQNDDLSDASLPVARPDESSMAALTMRPAARPALVESNLDVDIDVSVPELIIADVQRQIALREASERDKADDAVGSAIIKENAIGSDRSVKETIKTQSVAPVLRTIEMTAPEVSVSTGGVIPRVIPKVAINTSDVVAGDFVDDQEHFRSTMSQNDDITVALDYARTLIANMLLVEARSFLVGYERKYGSDFRIDALLEASRLLDGDGGGGEVSFEWKQDSLWAYLSLRSLDATRATSPEIRQGLKSLSDQSLPIRAHLTPVIFDTATSIHNQFLARSILEAAEELDELRGTSRLNYMKGNLAELEGKEADAFEFYAKASKKHDVYGAKSILALTSLVVNRDDPKLLPEVLNILSDANNEWRGGDVSLMLLARLALVAEELRQYETALSVMSRITSEYPLSDEARLAKIRVPVIFGALISEFQIEEKNISHIVKSVRTLQPYVSDFDGWIEVRIAAAEALSTNGLLKAAVAEYVDIKRSTQGLPTHHQFNVDISLRIAELSIEIGELDEAGSELDEITPGDGYHRRYVLASIRSNRLDLIENVDTVIAENEGDSELLLEIAKSAVRADNLAWAVKGYKAYTASGGALSRKDAADYLRAIAATGDAGSIDLVKSPEHYDLRVIKDGITDPMPNIDRVDKNTARSMLQSASEVLDQLNDITKPGQ